MSAVVVLVDHPKMEKPPEKFVFWRWRWPWNWKHRATFTHNLFSFYD